MKKIILCIYLTLVLVGCSPSRTIVSSIPNPTADISIEESPTILPSPIASVMSIQTRPEIKTECIQITSSPEKRSRGILVLQQGLGSRLIFLDNETGNQKFVPDNASMKFWQAYVSPDRKWLIYELDWGDPNGETKFILTKADGVTQKEIPYYGDWGWSSIFWLNDSNLRVAEIDKTITYIDNFAFDPFAETKSLLTSDLPLIANNKNIDWHIDQQAHELGILTGTNLIYDPTLKRVLYPKVSESVSLFNVETNQEIVRYSIPGWGRLPKWSPDGGNLAIVGSMSNSPNREALDEFLMVPRDGPKFRQLTYLTSLFKSVHIEDYSWSPNGKQIALWLRTDNNKSTSDPNPFELLVLDVNTGNMTNYCVTGISSLYDELEFVTYPLPIIWSPDGTQLLITQQQDDDNKQTDVIVIDLINKLAYKAAENMQPIGWMTSEP